MKKIFLTSLLPLALMAGCGDGVPKIDNPNKIVVDGEPLTQQEFMTHYCVKKPNHKTCVLVSQAMAEDAAKAKPPVVSGK